MQWCLLPLHKYAVLTGRARRMEYWMFALFVLLIGIATSAVDLAFGWYDLDSGVGPLNTLANLALLIPSFTVAVRRLHDTDRSGWWLLLMLLPILGWLVLLVFMLLDSTPGENTYGPNPKDPPAEQAPSSPGGTAESSAERLAALDKLHTMHQRGVLSAAEYQREKARLLGGDN